MFETELSRCIKMDLALNNLQRLICHKSQRTKPNQTYNLTKARRRTNGSMTFSRALAPTASSRIWTRVTICIFFENNRYAKTASLNICAQISLCVYVFRWSTAGGGGQTFLWWEGCITGLWIIKGPHILNSKEFI